MRPLENTMHSFVVRIWEEEPAGDTDEAKWRGHITHALSDERRYFDDLEDILTFIRQYLEQPNVN